MADQVQKRKYKGLTKKQKDKIFIIGMLALPILNWLIFYMYVNIDSFKMAFQIPVGSEVVWSLDNFRGIISEFSSADSTLMSALKNTMIYFVTSVVITLPLSFLLSYFLYKKVAGYKIFRVIFYLPSIITASVLVILFKYLIAAETGPLAHILAKMGYELPALLFISKYATNTILFYTIAFGLGGNLVLFSGAMSNIDASVVEAAKIDGVTMPVEMLKIVIPLMWPTMSTVLIFQFMGIFSASGPILLFTQGAYNTYTLSYLIYDRVKFSGSYYYPSAVGLLMTAVGAPLALFIRWLLTRNLDDLTL